MATPLKILIVEDSPDDAELMVRELRRAGFEPAWRRVETEADFLAELKNAPDIILSDYSMPQFNGLRAAELLQESGLNIPFILISGTVGEDIAVEAMKRGATDYLLKDRIARLGSAVQRALEQKRLRDQQQKGGGGIALENGLLRGAGGFLAGRHAGRGQSGKENSAEPAHERAVENPPGRSPKIQMTPTQVEFAASQTKNPGQFMEKIA